MYVALRASQDLQASSCEDLRAFFLSRGLIQAPFLLSEPLHTRYIPYTTKGTQIPIGSIAVPFRGSYLEFYKVVPTRNYYGAFGYPLQWTVRALLAASAGGADKRVLLPAVLELQGEARSFGDLGFRV